MGEFEESAMGMVRPEENPLRIPKYQEAGFDIKTDYNHVGKADFDTPGFKSQDIGYSEANARVFYRHPVSDDEQLLIGFGGTHSKIMWRHNPDFRETGFGFFNVSIGATTKRLKNWFWRAGLTASIDGDIPGAKHSSVYRGMMWGRYTYRDDLGLHIGFVGQTGIRKDEVYPILGVDYTKKKWKLNVIFPVKVNAEYELNRDWSLEVAARRFSTRHRLDKAEPMSRGIMEYSNFGGEFGVNYRCAPCFTANVHVGSAFGGQLKVSNNRDKGATHYKFEGSAYLGAILSFLF